MVEMPIWPRRLDEFRLVGTADPGKTDSMSTGSRLEVLPECGEVVGGVSLWAMALSASHQAGDGGLAARGPWLRVDAG